MGRFYQSTEEKYSIFQKLDFKEACFKKITLTFF